MGTDSEYQASSFNIRPDFIMPSQSPVTVYRDATLVSEYHSQILEDGPPCEKDMVIFFLRLTETCGVDIVVQITFVVDCMLEILKSTTAGDLNQKGCADLISCVSRFVIHYMTEEGSRKERLRALCTPLAKGLLGATNLAKGCELCLEGLFNSEWWTVAETLTVQDVFEEVVVKNEDKPSLITVQNKLESMVQSPDESDPGRKFSHESLPGSEFLYKSFWAKRELLSKFGPPVKVHDTESHIKVIVKVRPLTKEEKIVQGQKRCVRHDASQTLTWTGHPETSFQFDRVVDENATQENLFRVAGYPIVEHVMEGYNCCIFAYGQAGSGKTHTMLGDIHEGTPRHSVHCGMIPRVFEQLFSRIEKSYFNLSCGRMVDCVYQEKESRREEKLNFTCKCWCVEIFNDQMLDLLNHSAPRELQIIEAVEQGVAVENITELEIRNAPDLIQKLLQGPANRKVAATNMNRASSSHCVLTCSIEREWVSKGVTHSSVARLYLIDLAGSERLNEATNIKSHSTLGPVIMDLVSLPKGKLLDMQDRDLKLTLLLQNSLCAKSRTIVVANISPAFSCSLETLDTLKFGQQAKLMKNRCESVAEILRSGGDPGEEQDAIVPFHSVDYMGVPSTQQVSVQKFRNYRALIEFARIVVYGEGAQKSRTPQVTFFDRNGNEKYASVFLPYKDFKPTAIFAIPRELKYFPFAP